MRVETKRLALTVCVLTAAVAVPAIAEAQCRTADSTGTQMLDKYKADVRSADGAMQAWLGRNGIPRVNPNTVVLVTDKTTCSKAMKAYNATLTGNGITPSGSVYVVKIGTVYVVKDPAQVGSGWDLEVVMDSEFRVKARLLA